MSRSAHPAGPRHADVLPEGHYAAPPADLNALDPKVWARTVTRDARRRRHRRRARRHARSPRSSARPPTSSTRPTSAARCRAWRERLRARTPTSSTPARPSCPAPSCAGCTRRGSTSTSAPAASWPPRWPPGCPPSASRLHGNNKSAARDRAGRRGRGRADRARLLPGDRPGRAHRAAARQAAAGADPGHRRRRGAHPRVHRHRARGPEVRHSRSPAGRPPRRCAGRCSSTALELIGIHSHIGSQIFDMSGFEVAAHRVVGAARGDPRRARGRAARDRPRRRPRHRVHPATTTRASRTRSPRRWARSSPASARRRGCARPRLSVEPGRAIVGPDRVHAVRGRHRSSRWRGCGRTSASTAACRTTSAPRCTTPSTASRSSRARSDAEPMLARVVGKHCESGDIVVQDAFLPADLAPGRPARGAGHRRVLPLHGQQLQPRAAPAGGRRRGRARRG